MSNDIPATPTDEAYFEHLESELDRAMGIAKRARKQGKDPSTDVEIPIARDMADRVENLLEIEGVADRVRELEAEMGREAAALELARDFAEGTVGDASADAAIIEGAVRTAVALLTEGVVAAPIEGIDRIEVNENDDGSRYVAVYYAGPIRSAGGTAQALSVLVADFTRTLLGIDQFKPRTEEVERYAEEVALYDDDVGLQYSPKDKETRFITEHCPIMLTGEPTGDDEVSGYRDLERVETNRPRGGMCLVLAEGIIQKAPKIQRYLDQLPELEWPWLEEFMEGHGTDNDSEETGETDASTATSGPLRADRSEKYLRDLIAGRPVFGHPSAPGGFRLRYGRARNHGFATAGVHPATMHLVDDFLAPGTQIKTELPGKAAGVIPVDSIEGPTVRLATGEVRRIDDVETAKELRNGVERILDAGEYLVNYGEFVENNQPLAPAGYATEWWLQEFEAAGGDAQALTDDPTIDLEQPGPAKAMAWSDATGAPLHPEFTYCWHDCSVEEFERLADDVTTAGTITDDKLEVPRTETCKQILETLLVPHEVDEETIYIASWQPLVRCLGIDATSGLTRNWERLPPWAKAYPSAIGAVNTVAPWPVRERAPTRVGTRMGRPEKSETRELNPAVHMLFPLGDAGGDQRDVEGAVTDTNGSITVDVGRRRCASCGNESFKPTCPSCDSHTELVFRCPDCGREIDADESGRRKCPRCAIEATPVDEMDIPLEATFHDALQAVGERATAFEILKGVKGLTSANKTPEPLEKGILRSKHGVSTFKDGTVRYDITDLPVTSVRPSELGQSAAIFRGLGYEEDIHGDPLRHDDQLVELRVQDIVIPRPAADHLLQTADFVDDLLESFYGLDPYYEVSDRDDLVGELVFGMAPHTSAAVVGRVVGFTDASVGYAHPYFHASKRRNCDGDEDCVMLLLDGLLNFSKSYLPAQRGGRMDAPLVMSTRIDPAEIDDEAHNVDTVSTYPASFYEATQRLADPDAVDIQIAETSVGTEGQYHGFAHTHDTTDIAAGPSLSAYKTLDSMMDKMNAQLELGRKLRAVEESDVAERVIEGHFLPDLLGNLRAFSTQKTRCLDCGQKYRRMPLSGDCRQCGGTINLTVHEGSVNKYMQTAQTVAEEYGAREYTKQRLEMLDRSLESLFQNDKNKPSSLGDFL